ncbi:MAG TPA: transaldolase [Candidatus Acidoferrum sp.]|nr:transaldolase [Candidatus Acidoferrum sp.]
MKVAVGADHAGFPLKGRVLEVVRERGHEPIDLGTDSTSPVDYPDIARAVGEAIQQGRAARGVLLCGSGVGASVAASKMRGVRSAVCHDTYSAHQGVEHDDMNVLALGARIIGPELMVELVSAFLAARYTAAERHERRLSKVVEIERGLMKEQAMENPLILMQKLGQSPWYDNIRRGLLTGGALERMIGDGDIVGLTSNPTIFEQALATGTDYDDALARLVKAGKSADEIADALTIEDIRGAAALFQPVFTRTGGKDGYVSIEVNPKYAGDTEKTVTEVVRLRKAVDRPNLMVKIPATRAGVTAIERSIADGFSINVTLIFSLERYAEVIDAYQSGLRRRVAAGQDVSRIASVASFFVSRVDSAVDAILEDRIRASGDADRGALEALRGKAAIANAKIAYQLFLEKFGTPAWGELERAGARVQRPLWASTSTKNPAYPDTYYVEALIGPDTVDTMPPQTVVAYKDHGKPEVRLTQGAGEARALMAELARVGVDMARVTQKLEEDGVASFARSFESLIRTVEKRREVR